MACPRSTEPCPGVPAWLFSPTLVVLIFCHLRALVHFQLVVNKVPARPRKWIILGPLVFPWPQPFLGLPLPESVTSHSRPNDGSQDMPLGLPFSEGVTGVPQGVLQQVLQEVSSWALSSAQQWVPQWALLIPWQVQWWDHSRSAFPSLCPFRHCLPLLEHPSKKNPK